MKIESDKFISDSPVNKVGFMVKQALKSEDICAIAESEPFKSGDNLLDIKMSINGIELDVEYFMTQLYDLYDTNVKQAAKEMFAEVVNDNVCSICDELETIKQKSEQINSLIPWDTLWDKDYIKEKFISNDKQ